MDLREALAAIEDEMDLGRPIGAATLPDEIRFFRVLHTLRDLICPQLGRFTKAADTRTGDLAAIIADCIVSAIGKIPIPAATVARHIVGIGTEKFCERPARLLEKINTQSDSIQTAEDDRSSLNDD